MIKALELMPKCMTPNRYERLYSGHQTPIQRAHNNALKESDFIGLEGRLILRGAGLTSLNLRQPPEGYKRSGQCW